MNHGIPGGRRKGNRESLVWKGSSTLGRGRLQTDCSTSTHPHQGPFLLSQARWPGPLWAHCLQCFSGHCDNCTASRDLVCVILLHGVCGVCACDLRVARGSGGKSWSRGVPSAVLVPGRSACSCLITQRVNFRTSQPLYAFVVFFKYII